MGKVKNYTREEAEALARQGRRVRLPGWQGWWTCKDGEIVNGAGCPRSFEAVARYSRYDSWRLLRERPTRAQLEAEVARLKAELEQTRVDRKSFDEVKLQLPGIYEQIGRMEAGAKTELALTREELAGTNRALETLQFQYSEASKELHAAEQQLVDLRTQLAEAKANALPFKVGDRVRHRHRNDTGVVIDTATRASVSWDSSVGVTHPYVTDMTLVDEAKPAGMSLPEKYEAFREALYTIAFKDCDDREVEVAEAVLDKCEPELARGTVDEAKPADPEWHPCDAATARGQLRNRNRVRHPETMGENYLFTEMTTSDGAAGKRTHPAVCYMTAHCGVQRKPEWPLEDLLMAESGSDGWEWSAPLAEGGGGK